MRGLAWRCLVVWTVAAAVPGCGDEGARGGGGVDGGSPPTPCPPDDPECRLGAACDTDAACQNRVFCDGRERCIGGVCVAAPDGPCDDGLACTEEVCFEEAQRCFWEPRHERCADDDLCNGVEICDVERGCIAGDPPACGDGNACTIDVCDPAVGCSYLARDLDLDGFVDRLCGGSDCDDSAPDGADRFPGATETCGDGIDSDCDDVEDIADTDCPTGNNTCERRIQLQVGAGRQYFNTFELEDGHDLVCSSIDDTPDAVFGVTIDEPHDLLIRGQGARFLPLIIEARDIGQCEDSAGDPRGCALGGVLSPTEIRIRDQPAGEMIFVVESSSSVYWLEAEQLPRTEVPAIDQCTSRTPELSTPPATGYFTDVRDRLDLSCTTAPGWYPDAVYKLTLDERSDVRITATSEQEEGPPGAPVDGTVLRLALTDDCSASSGELTCIEGMNPIIARPELPAGDYYVVVEPGGSGEPPTYEIEALVRPAATYALGDSCGSAAPVVESRFLDVAVDNSFSALVPSSCRDLATDVDVVLEFTLPTRRQAVLFVDAGGPHALSLRRGDCGMGRATDELACLDTVDDTQSFVSILEAGTYQAVVELPRPLADEPVTLRALLLTSDP